MQLGMIEQQRREIEKRDRKLKTNRLECQLSVLHEEDNNLKHEWPDGLLLLRIYFMATKTWPRLRKSWIHFQAVNKKPRRTLQDFEGQLNDEILLKMLTKRY